MSEAGVLDRAVAVQRGRRLEYFMIGWNGIEGWVAVVAGVVTNSISLVGFGIDSFVEVASGSILLWKAFCGIVAPKQQTPTLNKPNERKR